MKKFISLLILPTLLIVSCGPSAEEKATEEKRIADSVANATAQRIQDSIMAVQQQEELVQKALTDSIARQAELDSLKAELEKSKKKDASKPKAPKSPTKTPEEIMQEKDKKDLENFNKGRG